MLSLFQFRRRGLPFLLVLLFLLIVLRPLPVTLTSLHEPLELLLPHHPDHVDSMGRRVVPLTR
eukprot:COSAG06_NODE_13388_length_1262_cov_1.003439_2_plen_63_part_00